MSTGYVIFAHGSRIEAANQSVRSVAAELAQAGHLAHVQPAFLELGTPSLETAIDTLLAQGVTEIVVLPYFLTLGMHLERDLPRIVAGISRARNGLQIDIRSPLDGHPALVQILLERAGLRDQGSHT
ncbi:MAG TPA: CbiX/SirB N-terminal domain-containing protein [Candidatus Limnocylindrales bacterium]|nr:CbiX/SirB N-terminal domain-containing protein [Candidatus Limnocylindrales bacterium]